MAQAFRDALERALALSGRSLRSVTEEAAVSYEQFKKLRQRPDAKTNIEDATKVAAVVGLSLDLRPVRPGDPGEPMGLWGAEIIKLMSQLDLEDREAVLRMVRVMVAGRSP